MHKLFVFPMKNGTRIYIQMIPWLSFGVRKTINYKISKFCHFYTQTTVRGRKESGGFVFASQNGTRMHIQIIHWVSFWVNKYVIAKLHFYAPPDQTNFHSYVERVLNCYPQWLASEIGETLKFYRFQFCPPQMKARESSEYTVLFHFSWDSRIHRTLSVF